MWLRNENLISLPLDSVEVAALSSLCAGTTRPEHFSVLFEDFISEQNRQRRISILPTSVLPTSDSEDLLHPELSKRKEAKHILFYQHLSDNNWVILLANLRYDAPTVDAYFIGHVELSDLDPIVDRLTKLYWTRGVRRSTRIIWTQRVYVPGRFSTDNTFMSFTLLLLLQRSYAYLDLTMDLMNSYKFKLPKLLQLLQGHDRWLGELKIEELSKSSLPFIADGYEGRDNLEDLYRLGWTVRDVLGDGNCGFYALLLGLLNIGIREFDANKDNWRRILFKFRNSLRIHSQHMLKSIYPRKPWEDCNSIAWIVAQATNEKETKSLTESLAPTRCRKPDDYLTAKFKECTDYHMNPGWAPHVLASRYQIRVIVYLMVVQGEKHSWSIQTFEYANDRHVSSQAPHVKVEQLYDLTDFEAFKAARISDEEFKRIPTIEILFQTGFEEDSTHHFQYLQRSVCSSIREQSSFPQGTLKEFLRVQADAQHSPEPINKASENTEDLMDLLLEDFMDLDPRSDKELLEGASLFDTIQKTPPRMAKGTKRSIKTPLFLYTKKPAIRVTAAMDAMPPTGRAVRQEVPSSHVTASAESLVGGPPPVPVREPLNHMGSSRKAAPTRVNARSRATEPNVPVPPTMREAPPSQENRIRESLGGGRQPVPIPQPPVPIPQPPVPIPQPPIPIPVAPIPIPAPIPGNRVNAPIELVTDVVSMYQQEERSFSLCYPMANALDYAEYSTQAVEILLEADRVASSGSEHQIGKLTQAMQAIIPVIASPTIFNNRLTTSNRSMKRKLKWSDLFQERSEYPTIVIVGDYEHAFCVVDDLIFDSMSARALRLCMESVRWLCGGQEEPTIKSAYRYETKYSPPGIPKKHRTKGVYMHKPRNNWNHD